MTNDNVTPIDTRVSPTIAREAALAAFPERARTNPAAVALGEQAATMRARLVQLADLVDAIEADTTLTDDARTLAAVKAAKRTREQIAADTNRMRETLSKANRELQVSFEAELAENHGGHGLNPQQSLDLALRQAQANGGGLAGFRQVVESATAERDGASVLAVYRAPAWALGLDAQQGAQLRDSIERAWSQPHVDARDAFAKAGQYVDRVAKIATAAATPESLDLAVASRAEANATARKAAESAAAGGDA